MSQSLPPWLSRHHDELRLRVRAVPRASRNQVDGAIGDELKIRLTTPPVDGKANQDLVKLLARTLGLARREVQLLQGSTRRSKVFSLPARALPKLLQLAGNVP